MRLRSATAIAGLAFGLVVGTAQADTIKIFNVSGTFTDGSDIGGTLTIDVTTGFVEGAALTTNNPTIPGTYSNVIVQGYSIGFGNSFGVYVQSGAVQYPVIGLFLDATSLVDYNGGVIYSLDQRSPVAPLGGPGPGNASGVRFDFFGNGSLILQSGSVGAGSIVPPMTTVPLPASAPMFGAALLALGAVGYGLKRKGAAAA